MKKGYIFKKIDGNYGYPYLAKRSPHYSKIHMKSSITHTSVVEKARVVYGEDKAIALMKDLMGWGEYEMILLNT